jgi:hypothetical protein
MKSVCSYRQAYGGEAIQNSLQSLRQHGRPSPRWTGVVDAKDLSITVRKIGGDISGAYRCKYSDTVGCLKTKVGGWGFEGAAGMIDMGLLHEHRQLRQWATLSEEAVPDGAELTAVYYKYEQTIAEY